MHDDILNLISKLSRDISELQKRTDDLETTTNSIKAAQQTIQAEHQKLKNTVSRIASENARLAEAQRKNDEAQVKIIEQQVKLLQRVQKVEHENAINSGKLKVLELEARERELREERQRRLAQLFFNFRDALKNLESFELPFDKYVMLRQIVDRFPKNLLNPNALDSLADKDAAANILDEFDKLAKATGAKLTKDELKDLADLPVLREKIINGDAELVIRGNNRTDLQRRKAFLTTTKNEMQKRPDPSKLSMKILLAFAILCCVIGPALLFFPWPEKSTVITNAGFYIIGAGGGLFLIHYFRNKEARLRTVLKELDVVEAKLSTTESLFVNLTMEMDRCKGELTAIIERRPILSKIV